MNKGIKKLAEEISFKLLATKNHEDFEWLIDKLSQYYSDDDISDDENILGVNDPLPGEEGLDDWVNDPDVQEFLEMQEEQGPWSEEDDKIYTVGGLTADKDRDFVKFIKKMK